MSITGMSKNTGKILAELEHLKQSIVDVLMTPIGSRIMLRDYGSKFFELIDSLINDRLKIQIYAATAEALAKWEPRFKCVKASISSIENGRIGLFLEGEYLPNGQKITLDGVVIL
jgi:phage baseplate assembly protein W